MSASSERPESTAAGAVRISDVASAAGVSVATVSRALNNRSTVNAELAQRVRDAANRLGYQPNAVARNLRRRRTDVLALIFSDVANPFYTSVARGVEDVARAAGYSVMLCNADEDHAKEASYLSVAEQQQVAGVVISPHGATTDVTRLRRADIPVVGIDRSPGATIDIVKVRSRAAAKAATDHLLAMGWQRPACVSGPEDAETAQERYLGYVDSVAEAGLPVRAARAPYTVEGGAAAAVQLLDVDQPPDAFIVANASLALGVLQELKQRGIGVGVEVGIVSFDESPWAPLMTPSLSVVAQPAYEIGRRAAGLLLRRIDGGEAGAAPSEVVLDAEIIVRESSQRRVADADR